MDIITGSESTLEPDTGPDRLLPAQSYTSCNPAIPVKIWRPEVEDEEDCDDEDFRTSVSVVTLLTRAAEDAPEHTALAVKREGEWVKWSYDKYLEDVRSVGKAFIKLGRVFDLAVFAVFVGDVYFHFFELNHLSVFVAGLDTGIFCLAPW